MRYSLLRMIRSVTLFGNKKGPCGTKHRDPRKGESDEELVTMIPKRTIPATQKDTP